LPRPDWLRVRFPTGPNYQDLKDLARGLSLHTVCEEAHCPNIGECWGHRTATFMILGRVCTRACRFCMITAGQPVGVDHAEPERVAEAVARLGLRHAVITSVARDDQTDGGAGSFAETIRAIRRRSPDCSVEVLIPDFQGSAESLQIVMDARPEILNHNVETVRRLQRRVRSKAFYERSLEVLERAKAMQPNGLTKSGMMLGLGEERAEISETLRDLRAVGCDIVTIGQYLRPSELHLPIVRYVPPEEFAELKAEGLALGFRHVESGPLVRSSYHAHEQVQRVNG
jgi:lipoic acid synthetase